MCFLLLERHAGIVVTHLARHGLREGSLHCFHHFLRAIAGRCGGVDLRGAVEVETHGELRAAALLHMRQGAERDQDDANLETVSQSVVRQGLAGAGEHALLSAFCERCEQAGLDLSSAAAVIDTLHPIWEGRAFFWRNDGVEEEPMIEYGSTSTGEEAERWRRSAFYHLLTTSDDEVRRNLSDPADFMLLDELAVQGHTDYLALVHRFAGDGVIGEMDCIYSHWTTRKPGGFDEADCAALRRLVPMLALALKAASLARIAGTLVEIYLGKDAGQQVLNGRISRGVSERISAVLWFSDLCGFTTIADNSSPDEIIPLLNDYAEIVIAAVHEAGGDVLKLIGDGTLAIFKIGDRAAACRAALRAEAQMKKRRRSAEYAPPLGRASGHFAPTRIAHWRGFLRQHRQRRSAGFHGGRASGQ